MPSFTDSLACACPSWNEFSGVHNPTHVWHRWCITTVNELRNSGWLPLAPEPPLHPSSIAPELQPCSSIPCLLGTDSVRYYMRHQQQRFLPGANDFFSKVGSTWVDITWITDVLVWIDLWGPSSSPSPKGWSRASHPGSLASCIPKVSSNHVIIWGGYTFTGMGLPFPKHVWNYSLGIWWEVEALRGTSLVVQWLRLCTSRTGGVGSIPGWTAKIPNAKQHSPKKKKWKESNYSSTSKQIRYYKWMASVLKLLFSPV